MIKTLLKITFFYSLLMWAVAASDYCEYKYKDCKQGDIIYVSGDENVAAYCDFEKEIIRTQQYTVGNLTRQEYLCVRIDTPRQKRRN